MCCVMLRCDVVSVCVGVLRYVASCGVVLLCCVMMLCHVIV